MTRSRPIAENKCYQSDNVIDAYLPVAISVGGLGHKGMSSTGEYEIQYEYDVVHVYLAVEIGITGAMADALHCGVDYESLTVGEYP
jgi:hypothetical protein